MLSELVSSCSSEPTTTTMACASLVVSLHQLRGNRLSKHVPSLILLNAGEAAPDPVDKFVRGFVHDEEANRPGVQKSRYGHSIKPEDAPAIMAEAIQKRQKLAPVNELTFLGAETASIHEETYHVAANSGYGTGCSRAYSKACADDFGLLTESDDQLILRLNKATDRAAFRHDVLTKADRLLMREGIGRYLQMVRKSVSVSGSLTVDL